MTLFVFPQSELGPHIDEYYQLEAKIARGAGAEVRFVSSDGVLDTPVGKTHLAVYRGWMMPPVRYEQLYHALFYTQGVRLINERAQYAACHWLPNALPHLSPTPRTLVIPATDGDANTDPLSIFSCVAQYFGAAPIVVKDYVKSQAGLWDTACFIPDATDATHFAAVLNEFLKWVDTEGGLVFREYVPLRVVSEHPRRVRECRLWVVRGGVVYAEARYDDCACDAALRVARPAIAGLAHQSNFFTLDVAQRRNGKWIILEAGDGGVSGTDAPADVIPGILRAL